MYIYKIVNLLKSSDNIHGMTYTTKIMLSCIAIIKTGYFENIDPAQSTCKYCVYIINKQLRHKYVLLIFPSTGIYKKSPNRIRPSRYYIAGIHGVAQITN